MKPLGMMMNRYTVAASTTREITIVTGR